MCVNKKNISQLDWNLLVALLRTEASSSLCTHPPWCHKTKACQVSHFWKPFVSHPLLHLPLCSFVSLPLSLNKYNLPRSWGAVAKCDGEVTKYSCHVFHYFWGQGGKEQEGQCRQTCVLGPSSRVAEIPPDPPFLANRNEYMRMTLRAKLF